VVGLSYLTAEGAYASATNVGCPRESFDYAPGRSEAVYCFDENNQPALDEVGAHGQRVRRDAQGRILELEFLGRDGEPVVNRTTGVARTEWTFDGRVEVARRHFGPDGRPALFMGTRYARLESRWDDHGRLIEEKRFGADGRLRIDPDPNVGFAALRLGYDADGAENERCYFDADDRLMIHSTEGFACRRTSRTQAGGIETMTTWTERADGKPFAPPRFGFAKFQREMTSNGIQIAARFLDADDHLVEVASAGGIAEQENRLDARGRLAGVYFHGADGSPRVNRLCGYASFEMAYAPDGRISAIQLRGIGGERVNHPRLGFSAVRLTTGEARSTRYIAVDASGQPVGTVDSRILDDLESGRFESDVVGRFLLSGKSCLL